MVGIDTRARTRVHRLTTLMLLMLGMGMIQMRRLRGWTMSGVSKALRSFYTTYLHPHRTIYIHDKYIPLYLLGDRS